MDVEMEFVSADRKKLMTAPEYPQYANGAISLVDDVPMEVDARESEQTTRQDGSNGASPEAHGRDLDFDTQLPRPTREPRSRRDRTRIHRSRPQGDFYTPKTSVYHDPDDFRGRAYRYDRQYREASPETLRLRAEAAIVSGMADMDVKQEPENRRDGDRYRGGGNGGGNKRRRDGRLAPKRSQSPNETDTHR
jgi:hypothetical protein